MQELSDQTLETEIAHADKLIRAKEEIGKAVFGQDVAVELVLASILAGGHALLVGVPGLAKTRLVETIAKVMGLEAARIQFTPDLMPADILGTEVLEEAAGGARGFRFLKGPVFTQLLMADEINRASPRTQSALLQAMQERVVSVAGRSHPLPAPFHVLATQNPIEQEGTYPLPEAQLDRFLLRVDVTYPDRVTERKVLIETTSAGAESPRLAISAQELMAIQDFVRAMPVGENLVEAVLSLIRNARPESSDLDVVKDNVIIGPSPRAGQAMMGIMRARALMRGRLSPSLEDFEAVAYPCLSHRIQLKYRPRGEGQTMRGLVDTLVKSATKA